MLKSAIAEKNEMEIGQNFTPDSALLSLWTNAVFVLMCALQKLSNIVTCAVLFLVGNF